MERLGPVLMDAVLPIPPAIFVINDEAGVGIDGCSAPDTASEFIDGNETLGPVLMDVVLPIPPVRLMF